MLVNSVCSGHWAQGLGTLAGILNTQQHAPCWGMSGVVGYTSATAPLDALLCFLHVDRGHQFNEHMLLSYLNQVSDWTTIMCLLEAGLGCSLPITFLSVLGKVL